MNEETKINHDIDTQLMLRLKKGNIKALETLYKKHISDVTNFFLYIGKTDGYSQDLAHEVFLRLWLKRESFRGDSNFEEFLYGFARNILKEHYR